MRVTTISVPPEAAESVPRPRCDDCGRHVPIVRAISVGSITLRLCTACGNALRDLLPRLAQPRAMNARHFAVLAILAATPARRGSLATIRAGAGGYITNTVKSLVDRGLIVESLPGTYELTAKGAAELATEGLDEQ